MSDLTRTELETLKRVLDEATPGPWISRVEGRDHQSGDSFIQTAQDDLYVVGASAADLDLIVAARSDLPRLIAELERLRAILAGHPAAAE